jgi:hypothetical protein
MKGNDISGHSSPRIIIVFEDAIGILPAASVRAYQKHARRNQWYQAARLFQLDPLMMAQLIKIMRNQDLNVEVVTYIGPQALADELAVILQEIEMVPVRQVVASTPEVTARRATFSPDIISVYDPEPSRWLTYGGKGIHLTSVHQVGR